jgi:membrane protease subunit HflC
MNRIAAIAVLALVTIVAMSAVYTLNETEQVIITQFGEPVGGAVTTPGLHFKLPYQTVRRFDKRWLPFDGDANQIPTGDKKFIWVDTYARWRIADPLKFYQSVRDVRQAQSRLDDIIDGKTRDAIASFDLIEIVRTSNRQFELDDDSEGIVGQSAQAEIETGRNEISRMILDASSIVTPNFGIELVDVQIKRINYTEEVQNSVFERMISERKRIAERSRSEGQGRAAEIRGQRERELNEITSEAFKTAEQTRGLADAEATGIYARAYSRDPDFYQFLKTLETYRSSLDEDVTMLLGSDSEFLSFLKRSR